MALCTLAKRQKWYYWERMCSRNIKKTLSAPEILLTGAGYQILLYLTVNKAASYVHCEECADRSLAVDG
jgi:hypothetical protein